MKSLFYTKDELINSSKNSSARIPLRDIFLIKPHHEAVSLLLSSIPRELFVISNNPNPKRIFKDHPQYIPVYLLDQIIENYHKFLHAKFYRLYNNQTVFTKSANREKSSEYENKNLINPDLLLAYYKSGNFSAYYLEFGAALGNLGYSQSYSLLIYAMLLKNQKDLSTELVSKTRLNVEKHFDSVAYYLTDVIENCYMIYSYNGSNTYMYDMNFTKFSALPEFDFSSVLLLDKTQIFNYLKANLIHDRSTFDSDYFVFRYTDEFLALPESQQNRFKERLHKMGVEFQYLPKEESVKDLTMSIKEFNTDFILDFDRLDVIDYLLTSSKDSIESKQKGKLVNYLEAMYKRSRIRE